MMAFYVGEGAAWREMQPLFVSGRFHFVLVFLMLFNFCCRLSFTGHVFFRKVIPAFLCVLTRRVYFMQRFNDGQEQEYILMFL